MCAFREETRREKYVSTPVLDGDGLLYNLDITDVVIPAGNLLATLSPFPTTNALRDVGGPYDDDGVVK